VKGRAVPHLQTKDVKFVRRAGAAVVTGKILQKEVPDDLVTSVPVYASVGKTLVLLGRVFADGAETSFRLHAPPEAKSVVLDPYGTVLTRP
jgi:hypothetical protein